ncbi:hypothetical protein LP414_00805 [Polaromonas sp. P1(28)-13]|nr:hypothetical protein LP414_00805 [Polaromonas sp. P1(28)-13]
MERAKSGEASHMITDWPGKNSSGSYLLVAILIPLALCIAVQWSAPTKQDAAATTPILMLVYFLVMGVGLVGRGICRKELKTKLRLFKYLPNVEAYAQATNSTQSEAGVRLFYWYVRWCWCVDLAIAGFATVGLFQMLVI